MSTGLHSARALEYLGGSAWERACFFALRRLLWQCWRPRDEVEALLVDELVQYELIRRQWIGVLAMRARDPRTITSLGRDRDDDEERTQSRAKSMRETLRALDQLQRFMHNSLRMLLRLRRAKSPVFMRHAGQVNVAAGPQMNLQATRQDDPTVPTQSAPTPSADGEEQPSALCNEASIPAAVPARGVPLS
jgi:hypothetical protein